MPRIISDYTNQAKSRIAQAAFILFSKNGYRNVKMDEIAREVGVTKADLYHYFPSKASLVSELGSDFQDSFVRLVADSLKGAESPTDLVNALEEVYEAQDSQTRLWFDLLAESSNNHEIAESIRLVNTGCVKAIKEAISPMLEKKGKRFGSPSPDYRAMSVSLLLSGAQMNRKLGVPKEDVRRALRESLREVLTM
jgi:AcrR family transcriptional regulator